MSNAELSGLQQEALAIAGALDDAGIEHALIGGLAVLLHGSERVTFDIDFLLHNECREAFVALLRTRGYESMHEAVSFGNYVIPGRRRVDALYARTDAGRGMLARARVSELAGDRIRVAAPEDLIGLKLQAVHNDPRRFRDWGDIRVLLALRDGNLDMLRVREYFAIFGFHEQLEQLLAKP